MVPLSPLPCPHLLRGSKYGETGQPRPPPPAQTPHLPLPRTGQQRVLGLGQVEPPGRQMEQVRRTESAPALAVVGQDPGLQARQLAAKLEQTFEEY